MPVRQPRQPRSTSIVLDINEAEAATLEPRRIALAIIDEHVLRVQPRDVVIATVKEYRELAKQRRAAVTEVRELLRNRHALRGQNGGSRHETQYIDELVKRVKLAVPLRTSCDIGLVAHMARIRGQIDVPLVVAGHVLAELGWRQCEIANALDENARQVRRLLARTAL